ncbi:MAG: PHB depolymerase family esterase [Pirellulales bacterium]
MRPILIASFLAGLVLRLPAFGAAPRRPAAERSINVDGRERTYRIFLPQRVSNPAPVVLCLHGGSGNAAQMERYSQFDDVAERQGFIVVYPESVGGNWNDGRGEPAIRAQRENIDDVKYLRAVVDDVAGQHAIDHTRVFATGISNGGMMSHLLAADASDLVAAIAPVVGGMPAAWADQFAPGRPVSILIIQGEADPIVPFNGGEVTVGRAKRGKLISTPDALRKYARLNGNAEPPQTTTLDAKAADSTAVEITRYPPGTGGAKTELYVVKGGGHAWPGRPQYLPESTIGKASQAFAASAVIWDFFKSCPARVASEK